MAKAEERIHDELVDSLQGEKIVTLVTKDAETNEPELSIISWLVAHPGGKTIKFAVGHNADSATNIQENPQIVLGVTGAESCYSIKGKATVSDVIEKTMKLRVITVEVESVKDVIFYGGKITSETTYEKTYDPKLAEKLDSEIYSLLNEA
ncbi:pyridoxamine 5'-phosphate oxidase family protein [Salipaludibacillus daqingensis]|uniref:pyridoxamine 5'-phosphate oxidase family protein n=1 Tax=Salipaludibacillus daqingensis TaxID=3041001 RepID=UPI002476BCD9|nr:pyridoxamine 5'-phosphate oxidase family protein [Salipaludibacillus daqingensis]